MVSIYKFSINFLLLFSVIFIIYSYFTAKNVTEDGKLPKVYAYLYTKMNSYSFTSYLMGYLESRFTLIKVNRGSARIYAVVLVSLYLPIFVIVFSFMNQYITAWYFVLLNFVICGVFPLFYIKNFSNKKCLQSRVDMLRSFTSLAPLLASNKMEIAVDQVISSSTGNVRDIWSNFLDKYNLDKLEAYNYIQTIVGDSYTNSVVQNLVKFDTDGVDPCQEILRIAEHAMDMYRLEALKHKGFGDMKFVVIICLLFNLGVGVFGKLILGQMNSNFDPTLVYLGIVMCCISFTLCHIFEG